MRKGTGNLVILLLAALLLLGAVSPSHYSPLGDIKFTNVDVVQADIDIMLYTPRNTTFSPEFVQREVKIINDSIKRYAQNKGFPTDICKEVNLDIYIVSPSVINDKNRYPVTENNVDDRWAMYDPYTEDPDTSSILLTDRDSLIIDRVLLGHEMSHYFYDTMCWDQYWIGGTESLAIDFQGFYSMERFGRRVK